MLSIVGLDNFVSCSMPGKFTPFSFDIWEQFQVPEGVIRNDVIDTIKLECAELPLIYTEPKLMQSAIGLWCRNRLPSWERMYKALTADYNPIHNYDRKETRSLTRHQTGNEEHQDNLNRSETGTETTNETGKATNTTNTSSDTTRNEERNLNGTQSSQNSETTTNSKSAFNNAGNMVDANTQRVTGNSSGTSSDTGTIQTTDNMSGNADSSADTTLNRKNDNSVTIDENTNGTSKNDTNVTEGESLDVAGNIGVTTNQKMITSEMELRAQYDMDSIIAGEFKRQFCVMVY